MVPSQLVCRPEQDLPAAVLRISGTLDLVTGGSLQSAVRRSLARQPARLVLDVSDMHVSDPIGLTALGAVACQTAEWPAVPIVLCGADRRTVDMVSSSPDCAGLRWAADRTRALAEIGPPTPRLRARWRPVPDACREARSLVARCCRQWGRDDLVATASLIATELVANVVRHARTTMEFTLGLPGGGLSMTVRDGSRRMPEPADPGPAESGGRGLRLVRDLTDGWGVVPVPDGKVVWTRFTAT